MTISASLLRDYETAAEAHASLRKMLLESTARRDVPEYAVHKISLDLTDFLERIQYELEVAASRVDLPGTLSPLEVAHDHVISDTFNGNVMVRRYPDGRLIVVDRNFFLLLVCYVYFQSRPKAYGPRLAAWMLVHGCNFPSKPFPLLEVFYRHALRRDPTLIEGLCKSIGTFLLAHELGHRHERQCGMAYLRARTVDPKSLDPERTDIGDFQLRPDGAIYNVLMDGRSPPILLFPLDREGWLAELNADLFACYLHVSKFAKGGDGLESLANHLCVWQQVLRLVDLRERYQDRSPENLRSHPVSTIRMDSIVHHFERLALDFAPDFRSEAFSILRKQYEKTWSSEFFSAWSACSMYFFYTIDHTPLKSSEYSEALGERNYVPGIYRQLLEDFAVPAVRLLGVCSPTEAEERWDGMLQKFNDRCKLNGESVLEQLTCRIREVGLSF